MENNTNNKISTPMAVIVAGVLIMIAILATKGSTGTDTSKPKTLSEQVGVAKTALDACIKGTDLQKTSDDIDASVERAMGIYDRSERGTPYSVVIGSNGVKTDIRGAETYENTKKIVEDAALGKVATTYKGNVSLSEPTDHVNGNTINPKVTIIEYSDFECPYCKMFQPTLERIVKENLNVKWIYRHYPLHQHSFEKLVAANCVAKLKGDDAFWKYGDLLFGLLKTSQDSVSDQL